MTPDKNKSLCAIFSPVTESQGSFSNGKLKYLGSTRLQKLPFFFFTNMTRSFLAISDYTIVSEQSPLKSRIICNRQLWFIVWRTGWKWSSPPLLFFVVWKTDERGFARFGVWRLGVGMKCSWMQKNWRLKSWHLNFIQTLCFGNVHVYDHIHSI